MPRRIPRLDGGGERVRRALVPASLQDWGPADGEVLADAFVAQMQAFDEEKASGLPRLPAAPARPPARLGATVSHC